MVKVDGIDGSGSDEFETVCRVLDDAKPQFHAKSWGPASGWIATDHLHFDPWTTSAQGHGGHGGHGGQTDINTSFDIIMIGHDTSFWPGTRTTRFGHTRVTTKF